MSTAEFALIDRHLTGLGARRGDVALGVGDDAALLDPPPGADLHVAWAHAADGEHRDPRACARTCVEGAAARLRAAGAVPAWAALALTLDGPDEAWVAAFAAALHAALAESGVCLVGGDTTAGPTAATLFLSGPGAA